MSAFGVEDGTFDGGMLPQYEPMVLLDSMATTVGDGNCAGPWSLLCFSDDYESWWLL
jgi:hypothetical protein